MRLSDFSTDEAMNVLCELTPLISNIVTDEELLEEIKKVIEPEQATNKAQLLMLGAEKITKIVPILLKKRKDDVFGILAVLNGKTYEEISKQNILVTAKQIRDLVKDKALIDFFKSCTEQEGNE